MRCRTNGVGCGVRGMGFRVIPPACDARGCARTRTTPACPFFTASSRGEWPALPRQRQCEALGQLGQDEPASGVVGQLPHAPFSPPVRVANCRPCQVSERLRMQGYEAPKVDSLEPRKYIHLGLITHKDSDRVVGPLPHDLCAPPGRAANCRPC